MSFGCLHGPSKVMMADVYSRNM